MQYRRANIPGACCFFTVNITERNKSLLIDHIHTLWQLPENDADFPTRWRLIKSAFSRTLPQTERITTSRSKKGERGIWQRRNWEHLIKDDKDFVRHVDYIHYNPVKHGYIQSPVNWPYSSIHRYIQKGIIQSDWAVKGDFDGCFGEV